MGKAPGPDFSGARVRRYSASRVASLFSSLITKPTGGTTKMTGEIGGQSFGDRFGGAGQVRGGSSRTGCREQDQCDRDEDGKGVSKTPFGSRGSSSRSLSRDFFHRFLAFDYPPRKLNAQLVAL
jgi:hypothetical protein